MKFLDALGAYSNPALEQIAFQQGLFEISDKGLRGSGRIRAIAQLSKNMAQPDQVARNIRQIGPVGRAMLKILLDGGSLSVERMGQALARAGVALRAPEDATMGETETKSNPDYIGIPSLKDAVTRCAMCGVIFAADPPSAAELANALGTRLIVPDEVTRAARDYDLLNEEYENLSADAPAQTYSITPADFLRDLGKYWRYARAQGGMRLTAQEWLFKSDFKNLQAAFNIQPPTDEARAQRLWFLRRMLMSLGLAGTTPNSILANEQAGDFFSLPMTERMAQTFASWLAQDVWNELAALEQADVGWGLAQVKPHDTPHSRVLRARLNVLRQLAFASQDAQGNVSSNWLSMDKFVEKMRADEYNFLYPRRDASANGMYLGGVYTNYRDPLELRFAKSYKETEAWSVVERKFIAHVLTGPLHWLGLLAFDRPPAGADAPARMRLTPAGAWLLNLAPAPAFAERGGRVLVQPNFTVLAMEPVSDAVLADIESFADYQSGDRAMNYTLTRQSVYRGQRAGWGANRIVAFLESHQGAPIPNNIKRSLEEWQQQHLRVTFVKNATLLQYADAATRQTAQEALDAAALEILSDTFDMAQPGTRASGLLQNLRAGGWSPLVTNPAQEPPEPLMRLSEDGAVALRHAVPDVIALNRVLPLTEQTPAGLRVSAKSVRAALANGQLVDEMIVTLGQLAEGGLPARLSANIHTWAAFYGSVALRPIMLLALPNAEVLASAIKDSDLGKYLSPIEQSGKALALVEPQHADVVRELLEDRGIFIQQ